MRSSSENTPQMNSSLRISSSPAERPRLLHQQPAAHGGEHHRRMLTSLLAVASSSATSAGAVAEAS